MQGLDDGKRGPFLSMLVQTLQQVALSQAWLPPQPQTNVAFLLTCYLKPIPRPAQGGFRLTSWWAVSPSAAGCPHSKAAAASVSHQSLYLLPALSDLLI